MTEQEAREVLSLALSHPVGNIPCSPADVNLEGESGIGDSISAVVHHKLLRMFCKSVIFKIKFLAR